MSTSGKGRVAVLGAGIMGSSAAILLARAGHDVVLADRDTVPLNGASRWNEGKVHLGYLYAGDPTLATARHVIPGSLAFAPIISELIGTSLEGHMTGDDDIYLVHRDSVVSAEEMQVRFANIDALIGEREDVASYPGRIMQSRRLSGAELADRTESRDIIGGFLVPERSVDTQWVADRLADALAAEPRIAFAGGTTITRARPLDGIDGRWVVDGSTPLDGAFDFVVNALWDGRLAVDLATGIEPEPGWSHRYRLCVFIRTTRPLDVGSALISLGGFGDVKNYDGTSFYASWYPVGLRATSHDLVLPAPAPLDAAGEAAFVRDVRAGLTPFIRGIGDVFDNAAKVAVKGGFVFAQAQGSLDRVESTIHRRDRFGIYRRGNYISVDTGKYGSAPWLARRLVEMVQ